MSEKVVCVHGQSARQCEMCDADRRIADLERENDTLRLQLHEMETGAKDQAELERDHERLSLELQQRCPAQWDDVVGGKIIGSPKCPHMPELEREIAELKNERDDALGIIVGVERAGPQYRALVEEITRWRNRMKARRLEASDGA